MRIYLFRHGDKAMEFSEDPSLSPRGEKQAQLLAKQIQELKVRKPDSIWASPRKRTQQSMRDAAEQSGCDMKITPLLGDRQTGETAKDFRSRIQLTLEECLREPVDCRYLCTHMDWIDEAMSIIPCSTDLMSARFSSWGTMRFLHFEISNGIWNLKSEGRIEIL